MEQYLRHFVDYMQEDWAHWLPGAEFAAINVESVLTSCSPFFANFGQHPRMGFEPLGPLPARQDQRLQALEADAFAIKMEELTQYLRDEMILA